MNQEKKKEDVYSLLLFLRLALVRRPLLFVSIQLGLPVYLVLAEEEDVFCVVLHAPHVCFLTFLLSPLEMKDRYVSIVGILCGEG